MRSAIREKTSRVEWIRDSAHRFGCRLKQNLELKKKKITWQVIIRFFSQHSIGFASTAVIWKSIMKIFSPQHKKVDHP
jgi:hypothetical protein